MTAGSSSVWMVREARSVVVGGTGAAKKGARSQHPPGVSGVRGFAPAIAFVCLIAFSCAAPAQLRHRAPGFEALPKEATIVIMPTDIELFEVSAGGVLEPKADWTDAASRHFAVALGARKNSLGIRTVDLSERAADETAEINTLHAAVARAISLHHFGMNSLRLPTKADRLDWSLGEAVREIKKRTGADYALFSWIRDSYASGGRAATMIIFALLGVGLGGGAQVGYASLVDLETGQVLWFNRLQRQSGDLREADKAAETLDVLLENFPVAK